MGPAERGSSVVEFIITMPGLLLAVLLIVQVGLWQHARHVALAAAQEGARAARAYNGSADAGRRRAEAYLAALAPHLLQPRTVAATRTATTATVQVRGRVTPVLPGLDLTVTETSTGPIEVFVPEVRGFTNPDAPPAGLSTRRPAGPTTEPRSR